MGNPPSGSPGPLGRVVPSATMGGDLCGVLLHPIAVVEDTGKPLDFKVRWGDNVGSRVLQLLQEMFPSGGAAGNQSDNTDGTNPGPTTFPGAREASTKPSTPGALLTTPGVCLRLGDVRFDPDHDAVTLKGSATATVEIPTPLPPAYDTPTDIPIYITSTTLSTSRLDLTGYASAYKVFRADFDLHLHYDPEEVLRRAAQLLINKNLNRAEMEDLLSHISVDASAFLHLGALPIASVKLSARSLVPLRHPLIGATDDLVPVQVAELAYHDLTMIGGQVIPGGVFSQLPYPGGGLHISRFKPDHGFSGTAAGLFLPNVTDPLSQPTVAGYLDVGYSKRVNDSLDVKVGVTYAYFWASPPETYSLSAAYILAGFKSWLPASEENPAPDMNVGGSNLMFMIHGQFSGL